MLELKSLMREVPDFPKPGINFIDITPLLLNAEAMKMITAMFVKRYKDKQITKVVGIESRGFIFAPQVAAELGAGFVPVRKPGKLPYKVKSATYELEYGTDTIEMHVDAINKDDKVVIIDDLIATGGTAKAAADLVTEMGGTVEELAFLIELAFLKPEEKLAPYKYHSIIEYK